MNSSQRILLDRLLDQYERSAHLSSPGSSNRRVLLKTHKSDFPEYDFQNVEVRDRYNAAIRELAQGKIIEVKWLRGSNDHVAQELWLNLEQLPAAYKAAARTPLAEQLDDFIRLLRGSAERCHDNLLKLRINAEADRLAEKKSLTGLCKNGLTAVGELLIAVEAFDGLRGDGVSMRAFSIRCYHDSKHFERIVKGMFLSFMRSAYPELQELVSQNDLGEREQLCYLGIYPRPEIYELAGDIRLLLPNGTCDLAPLGALGGAICGNAVDDIQHFDMGSTTSILFIENKTNYDEYLMRAFRKNQLVVFHGGFSSPQKKKLLQKLAEAANDGIEVWFWADIDMGGFKMFTQLLRIFPTLKPYRMSGDEVERFHGLGLERSKTYLDSLSALGRCPEYELFRAAIDAILRYGVTIEQEVMLDGL